MENLKKAAQEALDFNKHLNAVYVTSDTVVFADQSSAINHAFRLDDKTVQVFERETEENPSEYEDDITVKLSANDVIKLLSEAESEEAVEELIGNDERKSVKAAAAKRVAELKQLALDKQAANADQALLERQNATNNEGEQGE